MAHSSKKSLILHEIIQWWYFDENIIANNISKDETIGSDKIKFVPSIFSHIAFFQSFSALILIMTFSTAAADSNFKHTFNFKRIQVLIWNYELLMLISEAFLPKRMLWRKVNMPRAHSEMNNNRCRVQIPVHRIRLFNSRRSSFTLLLREFCWRNNNSLVNFFPIDILYVTIVSVFTSHTTAFIPVRPKAFLHSNAVALKVF